MRPLHRLRRPTAVAPRATPLPVAPVAVIWAVLSLTGGPPAHADVVTEWNRRAVEFVAAAGLPNQPAHRALAIAHTAALEAAQAVFEAPAVPAAARADVALPAAVGAAHCGTLRALLAASAPTLASLEAACRAALGAVAPGPAKDAGIDAGERAARDVLARRADDGATAPDQYRPHTTPGRYVPTTLPASPHWGQRRPWLMSGPAQFRPPPPPALDSERWARDFNEIKLVGAAKSPQRSAEQTETARFWETTHPSIYHALVRSVAERPGRDPLRNARLFAAFTQAIDDAMIAVFDAKYHYAFWRPITAIRNADLDGNEATERDAAWTPLIPTPMHPEYPCAHCVQAGVTAAVLAAEKAGVAAPVATASPSARGAVRRYTDLEAFAQEVANARVWDGVHYRFSTEAGTAIGRQVGALAVARFLGD